VISVLAELQFGVVARWQLMILGLEPQAIQRRIASGRLKPLHAGVYAVGHTKLTPQGYLMAAVLALGPGAVLSHVSAASHHGLRRTNQAKVDVTTHVSGQRGTKRIRAHRTRVLHPDDWTIADGIPVTSVARTLLDLAAELTNEQLLDALDEAVRLEVFDLGAIDRAIQRTPHRKGVPTLSKLLTDYRGAPDLRSWLERRFRHMVRAAGLPEPVYNATVAGYTVDAYFAGSGLVVELDSRRYHLTPRVFESDKVKDAALQRAGHPVLRITDKRMKQEPEAVLDDLVALNAMPPRA
jgi:very-short-patch-repair endonuclease